MAAEEQVTLVIRARDRTRTALRSIRRGARRLIGVFARVGAAVLAGLGAALVQTARRFEDIANAARFLGVSVRELQALQIIGRRFGLGADQVIDLLDEIRARAGEAALDGGEAAEAFERLGLSAADLERAPIDLLDRLGEAIAESDLNANQLAETLSQLGGDPARQLLPLLRQGGLRGRIQQALPLTAAPEAVETGAAASRESAEALTIASNRLADIVESFRPFAQQSLSGSPIALGGRILEELVEIRRNSEDGGTLN